MRAPDEAKLDGGGWAGNVCGSVAIDEGVEDVPGETGDIDAEIGEELYVWSIGGWYCAGKPWCASPKPGMARRLLNSNCEKSPIAAGVLWMVC